MFGRLQLHALAYNLGSFLKRAELPEEVTDWSLTSIQSRLIKIGARVVRHARKITFQLAEVAVPRNIFRQILDAIRNLKPPPKRRRERWQRHQDKIDPTRFVFIDETWVKTNMAPLRGWALKGERLPGAAPFGHWNTSTFIAALRHDRIDAPWVFGGPVNGDIFRTYVERVLVPTLSTGDIVVMDNLGSHKSQAVRRAIQSADAHLLFLPPYSPDLNPIEQAFSKLKQWIRSAGARTRDALWQAVGAILERFTPHECANYFENAGYASVKP